MSLQPSGPVSGRVAWYAVAVLMVAYTFSFIDRTILALLVVPVRRDLGIGDTAFGLLHGLAFAVFYTALGIPIARLADRYSRRLIMTVGVVVWSLATAVCGLARSFGQLFLARVAVGVGEAALSPAAYSLIADLFPRDRLSRALAVYNVGVFVGSGLALIIGGAVVALVADSAPVAVPVLGEIRGWQLTFFAVGLPGLLVALFTATVHEPRRAGAAVKAQPPLGEVLAFLRANRTTFLLHFFGFSALALFFNAVFAWSPALLIRRFGVSGGEAGLYIGTITLVFSTAGVIAGGWYADRLAHAGRVDGTLRAGIVAALALAPLVALALFMPSLGATLALYCPLMFFVSFPWAAAAAALQIVSPPAMRAQVSAVYLFVVNLAGIGLGPAAVGLLTEHVFGRDEAVNLSMACVGVAGAALAALLLWRGLGPFRASVGGVALPAAAAPGRAEE